MRVTGSMTIVLPCSTASPKLQSAFERLVQAAALRAVPSAPRKSCQPKVGIRARIHQRERPRVLHSRDVVLLALVLFSANVGGYVFILWLPATIEKSSSLSPAGSAAPP